MQRLQYFGSFLQLPLLLRECRAHPKTAWLIDYPVVRTEFIIYWWRVLMLLAMWVINWVTRLDYGFSKDGGEMNFLLLLPKEGR